MVLQHGWTLRTFCSVKCLMQRTNAAWLHHMKLFVMLTESERRTEGQGWWGVQHRAAVLSGGRVSVSQKVLESILVARATQQRECACCRGNGCVRVACEPVDRGPSASSVHAVLQTRILEWVAMPSSRGSPDPGVGPVCLLHWQADSLNWVTWKAHENVWKSLKKLNTELPHSPAIALLGTHPEKAGWKDTCTPRLLRQH